MKSGDVGGSTQTYIYGCVRDLEKMTKTTKLNTDWLLYRQSWRGTKNKILKILGEVIF